MSVEVSDLCVSNNFSFHVYLSESHPSFVCFESDPIKKHVVDLPCRTPMHYEVLLESSTLSFNHFTGILVDQVLDY